jgi:protein-L-isoaspartate(D-aspartate) O-methyltransferase
MGTRTIILFMTVIVILAEPCRAWADTAPFAQARRAMVDQQIRARGIADQRVLDAMEAVARHDFVPENLRGRAYADSPLPIGEGQTISQPYIVALMSAGLGLDGSERVLEIGTGSGYQAAVLSHLAASVYSMEIKPKLHRRATRLLNKLGYANVQTTGADGYFGWPDNAPFDAIMITAAVNHIPPPLLEQLKDGGRLILPLGNPFGYQNLVLVTKQAEDYTVKQITGVLFVPLTGHALEGR